MVSNICVFLVIVSIIATPILLLVSLIKWIRKKPVKKILLSALFSFCTIFVCSFIGALSMMPDSSNNANFEDDVISQQEDDRQNEEENICEHLWVETSREEPTEEEQGISYQKCEVCGETRRWFIPKIEHVVTFDEIYEMATGGLLNWSGGATLTMETTVDNTIVFFYASFEKEQEEALKSIDVGDEITFEGECLSAGTWIECELID